MFPIRNITFLFFVVIIWGFFVILVQFLGYPTRIDIYRDIFLETVPGEKTHSTLFDLSSKNYFPTSTMLSSVPSIKLDNFTAAIEKILSDPNSNFAKSFQCVWKGSPLFECTTIIRALHFPKMDQSKFRCIIGRLRLDPTILEKIDKRRQTDNYNIKEPQIFKSEPQPKTEGFYYPNKNTCILSGYLTMKFEGGLGNQMYMPNFMFSQNYGTHRPYFLIFIF